MSNVYNSNMINQGVIGKLELSPIERVQLFAGQKVVTKKAAKPVRHHDKEAKQKRVSQVLRHLEKCYSGKQFTINDVKKSLALSIRQWPSDWSSNRISVEISNILTTNKIKVIGKAERKEGKKGPASNLYKMDVID